MKTTEVLVFGAVFGLCSLALADNLPPVRVWTSMLGGTNDEWARNVACDSQGNTYASVISKGTYDGIANKGDWDALLTRFSPGGQRLWSRLIWGTNGTDEARGVTVSDGHVFLAGLCCPVGVKAQVRIAKWTVDGTTVWDIAPTATTGSSDTACGIAVGDDGSIYVVGYSDGNYVGGVNAGETDCFISKYTSNGTPVWHRLFGSAGSESLASCSLGPDGNLYVLGDSGQAFWGQYGDGGRDMLLMKWSPQGNCLWMRRWGGTSGEYPWPYGNTIACGPSGVFAAGTTDGSVDVQGSRGGNDAFCSKWQYDGTLDWVRVVGSASDEWAMGVAADDCGNAFLYFETVGSVDGQASRGMLDLGLSKFSDDGARQWTRMWGTSSNDWAIGGLCSSVTGTVYTVAYTGGSFPGYTNAGSRDVTVTRWNDPDRDNDMMEDKWETDVFGSMLSGGGGDDDGDGFINRHEFVADTNPLNDKSFMRISALTNEPSPTFYYPRSAARVYGLERRTNLVAGSWSPVPGQTNVSGSAAWLFDPEPPADKAFYRINVRLP